MARQPVKLLRIVTIMFTMMVVLLGASVSMAQESSIDKDLQRYWSGKREMPVIAGEQLFVTERRFELGIKGGMLPNDDFYLYFPVGANIGYHFDKIWGVELSAEYVGLKTNSELTDFLVDNGAGIRPEVDLGDNQLFRADVIATFSPFYGKWSFQTYKISHFDLFFMLGAGAVIVEEPEFADGALDPSPDPVIAAHPEALLGAGFRFFALDWMAIRLDARWFIYPSFDGVKAPAEVQVGVSFFTPAL